jgi:hypothetical protein
MKEEVTVEYRKFHNEELHSVRRIGYLIETVINLRRIGWVRHMTGMEEMEGENAHNILIRNHQRKTWFRRRDRRMEDNIKNVF